MKIQKRFNEVTERLSNIHKDNITCSRELCTATLFKFNKEHEDFGNYRTLQFELAQLAKDLGKDWVIC